MAQQIKTIIKFKRGTEGINNGKIFGFVTKKEGHWMGCRDDEKKKKIVFVDPSISKSIQENVPYNVTLIPMHSEQGFIATAATQVLFDAKIITRMSKGVFKVLVKFGIKTVMFDPSSNLERYNSITGIADLIRHRTDLKDPMQVAEDFIDSACLVRDLYKREKCS
jgi:hypothetical protein